MFSATVPDQVGTLSKVGTSSYMAYAMQELTQGVPIWLKKFLLGPIGNESSMQFSHLMFINSFCTCILVRVLFSYQKCDICGDLHMINLLRMAVLNIIRRWFLELEIKKNTVKAIISWGYPYSFKPKTLLLTDGDHFI